MFDAQDIKKLSDINLDDLNGLALSVASVEYDFSSENWTESRSDGLGWESADAARCETCGGVVVYHGFSAECENPDCENHCEMIEEDGGPMMNYYYELPDEPDDEEIAQLVDLPLCVVTVNGDTHALALTGGGMDLSWEICEAFIRLGYLPPLNFADLPMMAGRGVSENDRIITAACFRSARGAGERTESRSESIESSLENTVRMSEEYAAERPDIYPISPPVKLPPQTFTVIGVYEEPYGQRWAESFEADGVEQAEQEAHEWAESANAGGIIIAGVVKGNIKLVDMQTDGTE